MKKKFVIILFSFILFSCSKDNEIKLKCGYSEEICSALENLDKNKKKWLNSDIRSYSMSLRFSCYCLAYDPYSIIVLENNLESVSGNENWEYGNWPMTVNDIFEELEGKIIEDPFSFEIKYNSIYGYPEESYFDMVEMIADEEIGYYITNFLPL